MLSSKNNIKNLFMQDLLQLQTISTKTSYNLQNLSFRDKISLIVKATRDAKTTKDFADMAMYDTLIQQSSLYEDLIFFFGYKYSYTFNVKNFIY